VLERLGRGACGPLTVVTGPPGAGKTVAVSAWAAGGKTPGPVAWVSLDAADHETDLFWRQVVSALRQAGVEGLPRRPRTGHAHIFLTKLATAIAGRETPVVLVLDDFQPDTDTPLVDEVTYVVRNTGPVLRLVLISRRDPPLPLHRYRLTGELTEIRADTLAFGERETGALLAQHGVSLSAESVRALCERTEGWAAGLRLAAMSMEGHPAPEAFAAQFAGDDHAVVGYLMEEVLESQPADMHRLLLATSTARRFNAELAAELGGAEAGRCFPALVRQNAFVLPLGHGWYRYHHMFGDALNLILRHESPGEVADLYRRAAAWYSRKGLLADAVHHAARAGDWRYASWLIVDRLAIGQVLGLYAGHPFAVLVGDIPEHMWSAAAEPEPALVAAAAALARGDEETCTDALRRADELLAALPTDDALTARLAAAFIRLAWPSPRHLASIKSTLDEVDALLERLPGRPLDDHAELRALVGCGRGAAELRAGRPAEAAAAFRAALPAAVDAGSDLLRRWCLGGLALVEALLGRFRQAAESATKAAQLPEVSTSPAGRRVAAAHLASAWVALAQYRPSEARLELAKTRQAMNESGDETRDALLSVLGGLVTARTEIATGSPGRAIEALEVARKQAGDLPWLRRRVALVEAEAHAAAGAAGAAHEAARRAGGAKTADSAVALARVSLGVGDRAAAAKVLRPALVESMAAPNDVRVEAWLLDARLAYEAGDPSHGRRSLDRALRLGEREQLRLPFAMARNWLYAVLRRDPELVRPHRRLLEPLWAEAGAPAPPGVMADGGAADGDARVYGRLSTRELDVLRHVSEMLTTEEIAVEMYVSINTVKTHLKSIYRKLAVTRRGEAVRRAQHLELL
jgi:LuxR family maltose regulon positive regulatory protein